MALPVRKYTIGAARFAKGWRDGMTLAENGELLLSPYEPLHFFVSRKLNGGEASTEWGRLTVDAELPKDAKLKIHAYASDEDEAVAGGEVRKLDDFFTDDAVSSDEKLRTLAELGAKSFTNSRDMLLNGLEGRYLWFAFEITGADGGKIRDARVFAPRDSFLDAFPQVYRENNEFFERFLTIFTSIYMDVQRNVDDIWKYVDVDTAPDDMLPVFAEWLGIKVDGNFLPPDRLRTLVREGYGLCRSKGTRAAVSRVAEILTGERPIIVEQCEFAAASGRELEGGSGEKLREVYSRLYGSDPLGFTVLIDKENDEKYFACLSYMIDQFKPARSQVNIVFIKNCGQMDSHCYLDLNAHIIANVTASLDDSAMMSMNYVLA